MHVIRLAEALRASVPQLDFAVVGLGQGGDLPDWIADLRTRDITTVVEKRWCERYARSHVVIGVHGSNMLLPSGHAGATVELLPPDRLGNILQDLLLREDDARETLYRVRLLPLSTHSQEVAEVVLGLLKYQASSRLMMGPEHCRHNTGEEASAHAESLKTSAKENISMLRKEGWA
jgi:hypothetical protein